MAGQKQRSRKRLTHCDAKIGRRVLKMRVRAGLPQRELAFPGCSYAYLSRIEAGTRVPSLTVIRELARRLDTSEDFLCWGIEKKSGWRERALAAEAALRVANDRVAELENRLAGRPQRTLRAA